MKSISYLNKIIKENRFEFIVALFLFFTFLIFSFWVAVISAFPLQLLQNGTIIDLGTNETINGTQVDFIYYNDTLYLIPKVNVTNVYNISNITNINNITNVSYGNFTNLTTLNVSNYTNCSFNYTYYNATGNYTYNKTEIDNLIAGHITISSLSPYALRTELVPYALKSEINYTLNENELNKKIGENMFWIIIGIIAFILIVLTILIFARE